jgi:hypothetical protein
MTQTESAVKRIEISPTTIMRNAYAVYPSFAMLAGMQLDVFTPLCVQEDSLRQRSISPVRPGGV